MEKPEARRGGIAPGLLISSWFVTHCLVPHSGISVRFRDSLGPLRASGNAAYVTRAAAAPVGPAEPGAKGSGGDGDDEDGDRRTISLAQEKKSYII